MSDEESLSEERPMDTERLDEFHKLVHKPGHIEILTPILIRVDTLLAHAGVDCKYNCGRQFSLLYEYERLYAAHVETECQNRPIPHPIPRSSYHREIYDQFRFISKCTHVTINHSIRIPLRWPAVVDFGAGIKYTTGGHYYQRLEPDLKDNETVPSWEWTLVKPRDCTDPTFYLGSSEWILTLNGIDIPVNHCFAVCRGTSFRFYYSDGKVNFSVGLRFLHGEKTTATIQDFAIEETIYGLEDPRRLEKPAPRETRMSSIRHEWKQWSDLGLNLDRNVKWACLSEARKELKKVSRTV